VIPAHRQRSYGCSYLLFGAEPFRAQLGEVVAPMPFCGMLGKELPGCFPAPQRWHRFILLKDCKDLITFQGNC